MKIISIAIFLLTSQVFAQDQSVINDWKKVHLAYAAFTNRYCKPQAKVSRELYEAMSSALSINPRSINLERINISSVDATWGVYEKLGEAYDTIPKCTGTFYSPKGAHQCELEFNEQGLVVGACNIRSGYSYSRDLNNMRINLSLKARKKIESKKDAPAIRRYDSRTGRNLIDPSY